MIRTTDLRVPLLGRSFEAQVRSPALAGWLEEHWRFPEYRLPPHPYSIHLEELLAGEALPVLVGGDSQRARMLRRKLIWTNAGSVWQTGSADSGVRLDVLAGSSRVIVWGLDGEASHDVFAALYLALCEAVRASGLVPLHAAVGARAGRAVALGGASGAGKSTALLHLVEQGWSPIAEDFSWLDPGSGDVFGWDRGVRLWPSGLDHLPAALRGAGWSEAADGKLFLTYERLRVAHPRAARLARLALLERDASGPSARLPLASSEVVRALWEATGVPLVPTSRERFALLVPGLIARLRPVRLRIGPPPDPFDELV